MLCVQHVSLPLFLCHHLLLGLTPSLCMLPRFPSAHYSLLLAATHLFTLVHSVCVPLPSSQERERKGTMLKEIITAFYCSVSHLLEDHTHRLSTDLFFQRWFLLKCYLPVSLVFIDTVMCVFTILELVFSVWDREWDRQSICEPLWRFMHCLLIAEYFEAGQRVCSSIYKFQEPSILQ